MSKMKRISIVYYDNKHAIKYLTGKQYELSLVNHYSGDIKNYNNFIDYFGKEQVQFNSYSELKMAINNFATIYNLKLNIQIMYSYYETDKYYIEKSFVENNRWRVRYKFQYIDSFKGKKVKHNLLYKTGLGNYDGYNYCTSNKNYNNKDNFKDKLKDLFKYNYKKLVYNHSTLVLITYKNFGLYTQEIMGFGKTYKAAINDLEKINKKYKLNL